MGEPYCINIRKKTVDRFPQRIGDSPRIFSQLPPWQVIQEHVKLLQDARHQSLGQVKHLEGCCSAVFFFLWGFHGDFNGVFGAVKIELRKNGANDYRRKQIEGD